MNTGPVGEHSSFMHSYFNKANASDPIDHFAGLSQINPSQMTKQTEVVAFRRMFTAFQRAGLDLSRCDSNIKKKLYGQTLNSLLLESSWVKELLDFFPLLFDKYQEGFKRFEELSGSQVPNKDAPSLYFEYDRFLLTTPQSFSFYISYFSRIEIVDDQNPSINLELNPDLYTPDELVEIRRQYQESSDPELTFMAKFLLVTLEQEQNVRRAIQQMQHDLALLQQTKVGIDSFERNLPNQRTLFPLLFEICRVFAQGCKKADAALQTKGPEEERRVTIQTYEGLNELILQAHKIDYFAKQTKLYDFVYRGIKETNDPMALGLLSSAPSPDKFEKNIPKIAAAENKSAIDADDESWMSQEASSSSQPPKAKSKKKQNPQKAKATVTVTVAKGKANAELKAASASQETEIQPPANELSPIQTQLLEALRTRPEHKNHQRVRRWLTDEEKQAALKKIPDFEDKGVKKYAGLPQAELEKDVDISRL